MSIKHKKVETNVETSTQTPDVPDLIAVMNAGERYSARELGKLLDIRAPVLNGILAKALEAGTLREAGRSADNRYWIPTAEELAHKARLQQRNWWSQGPLTGYDTERNQFRTLCMLTRRG